MFEELKGLTLTDVQGAEEGSKEIRFCVDDGRVLVMEHDQDCCEEVQVIDVCGDIAALIGAPITMAEVAVSDNGDNPAAHPAGGAGDHYESFTWTFYKLATVKGYVTIRWLGESNGYYSESVDCGWIRP